MKEVIYGACAKHPNHSMINCPMCELEKYKVKEMTQETMTKEQILAQSLFEQLTQERELHHQQLSAERERAGKLVEALKDARNLLIEEGYAEWCTKICDIDKTLNEYDTATKES